MSSLKYKCLVLDHDDTVVNSTASIHYPAFLAALSRLRPDVSLNLEDYFKLNFDPGFMDYCLNTLNFSQKDFDDELLIWKEYVKCHTPVAYDGIREIIQIQKELGGYVCVVSHSFDFNIKRDYEANNLPLPDMIFGWECPPEQRKPSTYSLKVISERFNLKPTDMIMIDDLKPGYDMAKAFGTPFAGAGWANDIPEIRDFMKKNSDFYFSNVNALKDFLFSTNK